MLHFDYTSLINKTWDNEVINYLSLIHEYKGKQSVYIRQQPQELERLVEIAKATATSGKLPVTGMR